MSVAILHDLLCHAYAFQSVTLTALGGEGSYFNATYRVLADGQTYALQCVPLHSTVFAPLSHRQLPAILQALQQPARHVWYAHTLLDLVPAVRGSVDGHYVPLTLDGRAFEVRLFRWIASQPVVADLSRCTQAGALLADFHLAVREDAGLSALHAQAINPLPHFHDSAWYLQQWDAAVVAADWACDPASLSTQQALIAQGRELIGRFDAFRQQQLQTQPRIMHGDPKLANMLFDRDQAVALIDFDTVMTGLWHYDVADALRSLCNTQSEDGDPTQVQFDLQRCAAFLRGYAPALLCWTAEERARLSDAIALLPLELGIRFLFGCHQQHGLRLESDAARAARKSLLQLQLFADIEAQRPALQAVLDNCLPQPLRLHPQDKRQPPLQVSTVLRRQQHTLEVFYRLHATQPLTQCLAQTQAAPVVDGQPQRLWEHTCLEAFVSHPQQAAYVEFNGDRQGARDLFVFRRERVNAEGQPTSARVLPSCAPASAVHDWLFQPDADGHGALARWRLDLRSLPGVLDAQHALQVSVTAVLEDSAGQLYYLALQHCRAEPDFHARESLQWVC